MGKVTLKDLSKILNISVSTISKALNDSTEISTKTKKRVLKTVEIYGYQPNLIAKRLKSGKTFTFAVVIPSIQDSFFVRVLHGIEEAASITEYNLITCSTRNSYAKEVETIKSLSNGLVDGFIIEPGKETLIEQKFSHFKSLINSNKPIVFIDRGIESLKSCLIKSNNKQAVYNATNKLINKGKRKIGIVSYNSNINTGRERIEGYIQSLNEHNINILPSSITRLDKENSEKELQKHLSIDEFDAFICTDEQSSYDVLRMIKKSKFNVPDDISVIGYMDENVAQNIDPQLTTINQHRKTIGNKAFKLLIGNIHNIEMKEKTLKINSTLEIRESF